MDMAEEASRDRGRLRPPRDVELDPVTGRHDARLFDELELLEGRQDRLRVSCLLSEPLPQIDRRGFVRQPDDREFHDT